MKKNSLFLVLGLFIIMFSILGVVSAADCGGDIACICGDTLNDSRILDVNDLLTACEGTALIIGADDITLDCNGTTISGPGITYSNYAGVYSEYARDIIENCAIEDFDYGVQIYSDNNTVQDNNISDISIGIDSESSQYDGAMYVLRNMIDGAEDTAIYLDYAYDGDIIQYNHIYNSGEGIFLGVAINGDISYNIIIDTLIDDAISLDYCDDMNIQENVIDGVESTGIDIRDSEGGINIINNIITDSNGEGIYLYLVSYANIAENKINLSEDLGPIEQDAIYIEGEGDSSYNNIYNNKIYLLGGSYAGNQYGIYIEDDSNNITNNIIECTELPEEGLSYGMYLDGSYVLDAEDNLFSGNEISYCDYGLYAKGVIYFLAYDEDYHDNVYGAYLENVGTDELTYPVIGDSIIYNNNHGIYLTGSYALISDTNFTDNSGSEITTGLHVNGDSVVLLFNGNFESNGDYGIYDVGPGSVYWFLTEEASCVDNDISIYGWIVPFGGSITSDDCIINVNGEELNLSGGQDRNLFRTIY